MTGRVTGLYRHPIKGIGLEPLTKATLIAGHPMPGDRAFAMRHDNAEVEDGWQRCRNFLRVASGPDLAPVRAESHDDGTVTLTHPRRPELTLNPADDGTRLVEWVKPIWPQDRPAPTQVVMAPEQGMGDNGLAQVSLLNMSSLRALSQKLRQELQVERFRGNIAVDGLAPWEEFDLIGETIKVGDIRLEVTERIERCRATEANPITGVRDANTLRGLEDGWGHRDFGVYATVLAGGDIALNDPVEVP